MEVLKVAIGNQTDFCEEVKSMKKYIVYLEDANTGAKSEIDIITVNDDYTPEQYRKDCESNNCEWPEGEITFCEIEN